MNKKIFKLLSYLAIILLTILCMKFISKPDKKEPEPYKPDTVYITKSFKPEKVYKLKEYPKTVFYFLSKDTTVVENVILSPGTITLNTNLGTIDYSSQYLGKYPSAQKLIQMIVKNNTLSLTLLDTRGNIHSDLYDFYPELYNYNYSYDYDYLTQKRKSFIRDISPVVQVTARPVSRMYDIDLGLQYKTRNFNYEIGLNTYFYPSFDSHLGLGPYVRVRYTFDLWRKR